jgi:hypothetical protein
MCTPSQLHREGVAFLLGYSTIVVDMMHDLITTTDENRKIVYLTVLAFIALL